MPPLYKEGVYWLVLLAATVALYAVLAAFMGPVAALGAFGLLGLAGLQPLVYRKPRDAVAWDERDTLINYRAAIAGYSVSWLVFTLAPMGVWAAVHFYQGATTVSVDVLPALVMGGFIVMMTTRAIAIVVQYRRQNAGAGQ